MILTTIGMMLVFVAGVYLGAMYRDLSHKEEMESAQRLHKLRVDRLNAEMASMKVQRRGKDGRFVAK